MSNFRETLFELSEEAKIQTPETIISGLNNFFVTNKVLTILAAAKLDLSRHEDIKWQKENNIVVINDPIYVRDIATALGLQTKEKILLQVSGNWDYRKENDELYNIHFSGTYGTEQDGSIHERNFGIKLYTVKHIYPDIFTETIPRIVPNIDTRNPYRKSGPWVF